MKPTTSLMYQRRQSCIWLLLLMVTLLKCTLLVARIRSLFLVLLCQCSLFVLIPFGATDKAAVNILGRVIL